MYRFKDAREVYPSRKYEIFFWDNKATLAIKDTEPNDTGRYRCEVSNRLGRIESTGSLHVYSESCSLYVDSLLRRINLILPLKIRSVLTPLYSNKRFVKAGDAWMQFLRRFI